MTSQDERLTVLERRVEAMQRYLEEDRHIVESVDRLDVGVGNLSVVMGQLNKNKQEIARVDTAAKKSSHRNSLETRFYAIIALVVIVFGVIVATSNARVETERRKDLERLAVANCATANNRVDQIASLVNDLTVNATPEAKERIQKALSKYLDTRLDCEAPLEHA